MNGLPASQRVTERAVADVGNPVYVSVMREISRVVTKAGYRLVLSLDRR